MANTTGSGGRGVIKPLEVKRRQGNPGHQSLPREIDTQALVSATETDIVERVPATLEAPGAALWRYIWRTGATWISPQTEIPTVLRLCELTDFGEKMKAKFMTSGDTHYAKEYYAAVDRQITLMRELGLTPAARSKLGVAEVKTKTRIAQLQMEREREERLRSENAAARNGL